MDFFLLIGIVLGVISVVVGMIVKGANVAVLRKCHSKLGRTILKKRIGNGSRWNS